MMSNTVKTLFRSLGVSMTAQGGRYIVAVNGEGQPRLVTDNLMEAWTRYMDTLDVVARRRIGNMLEKQGRDRFTGKKAGAK